MTLYQHFSEGKDIDDNTTIWRYRSFRRYKQIINEGCIHFHRIDKFDDPFEGSIPELVDVIRQEQASPREARIDQALNRRFRQFTYANCWHMKRRESANMWERYGGDKNVIALKTTIGSLKDSFCSVDDIDIQLADIRYVDFIDTTFTELREKVPSGRLPAQWTIVKRASFQEESEFRAFIQPIPRIAPERYDELENNVIVDDIEEKVPIRIGDEVEYLDLTQEPSDDGINIDIEPNVLIEEIYVDPEAEEEYVEMITNTTEKFGVNPDKVNHSELSSEAIY